MSSHDDRLPWDESPNALERSFAKLAEWSRTADPREVLRLVADNLEGAIETMPIDLVRQLHRDCLGKPERAEFAAALARRLEGLPVKGWLRRGLDPGSPI